MKKTLVLTLSLVAIALSACQKTPEEKKKEEIAAALDKTTSKEEIQRLDEIRRQGDESLKKLLSDMKKGSSTKPEK